MRKLLSIAALLFLALGGCKPEPFGPSQRYNYITSGKWQLYQVTQYSNAGGMLDTLNLFPLFPKCKQDDYYVFNTDSSLVAFEGLTKCNDTDVNSKRIATWYLDVADTKLAQRSLDNNTTLSVIDMLNDTTLRYTYTFIDTNNDQYRTDYRYHNIN